MAITEKIKINEGWDVNDFAPYLKIAGKISELIKEGALRFGQKIPSTQVLAKKFEITVPTMQKSLALLVRQGYLKRTQGKGTFVIYEGTLKKRVGIVFGYNPLNEESRYNFLIMQQLRMISDVSEVYLKFYMDIDESNYGRTLNELEKDIENEEISVVVPISQCKMLAEWLDGDIGATVINLPELDIKGSISIGLNYLLKKGFRRILYVALSSSEDNPDFHVEVNTANKVFREFRCEKETPEIEILPGGACARYGYEVIKERFSKTHGHIPDALFVNHDVVTVGVLQALAELEVKVSDDIALLTHANKGEDFLCTKRLSRVEFDPALMAKMIMNVLSGQIGNRKNSLDYLSKPRLVIGNSCGE